MTVTYMIELEQEADGRSSAEVVALPGLLACGTTGPTAL